MKAAAAIIETTTGRVVNSLARGSAFEVKLDDDDRTIVARSGLWRQHVAVRAGDDVLVKVFSSGRGEVVWRYR